MFCVHYALYFETVSGCTIVVTQNLLGNKHTEKDSYSIVQGLFPDSGIDHLQFEPKTSNNTFPTENIFKERLSELPSYCSFKIASSLNSARKH